MNRMNRWKTAMPIVFLAAIALVVAARAQVQNSDEAEVLLQEAKHRALVDGDLERAIELCEKIISEYSGNRAAVAQALVQMGQCYEKLGRAEARKAYERVVQEFADQAEPVQVARQHLELLDAGTLETTGNGPTYRLVLDEKIVGMPFRLGADFSPDGDRIVFVSQNKLYIADQAGAVTRVLLDDLGPWEGVERLRWSPDSKLIAYTLSRAVSTDKGAEAVWAIFVVSPDGGTPRQVGPEIRNRTPGPFWTPDGQHLSYWINDGLHTLTLDGNEVRFVPKEDLPGVRLRSWYCAYSPDGRWLVCHRQKKGEPWELCILPATGGALRHIVDLPWSVYPTWAPDGHTLYFIRYTGDSANIWRIPMDMETGFATGEPKQVTFFKDTSIWHPQVLGDGGRIAFVVAKGVTSIQVADASTPQEARSLVRSGRYAPELSPDGQTVFFVKDGPGEEGIYAVSRQGGTPRRLTKSLPAKGDAPLDLSADGRTLAYVARLGDERGLYTLPTSGGEPKLLVKFVSGEDGISPQWSPDDSSLAYAVGKILYVIPATGGEPREVAQLDRPWEGYTIRWSPDGKSLAGFGYINEGNNGVFVVPVSGGGVRQLTPDVPDVEYWKSPWKQRLEWHPDGKRLTYHVSQYDSETRQVYLDGRPPSKFLNAPGIWDYEGAWAPDGRQFFFLGDRGLYVYDEASGKTTFVADCGDTDEESVPTWSRDGKTMAWCATRGTGQIWIMENFEGETHRDRSKSGVTVRKVWDHWGAPSPDGRYLAFCHWSAFGDLAIHDVVTGEDRDLSDGPRTWDGRIYWADETPVWSPDGKQIAYGWHPYPNMGKPEQLCIVGLNGSKPRVLYPNDSNDVTEIDVHDWSKDGKFILAGFRRAQKFFWDLVLVSVADGSVSTLTSIRPTIGRPAWQISRNLSPDGRYAVYDRSIKEQDGLRDIFLVSTDGSGEEIPLVEHPADDWAPLWAPDGKTIVFTSDRSGNYSTWLIPVADGKPAGEAQLVKRDIGPVLPLGFTREGSFYYAITIPTINGNVSFSIGDIYVASIDPASGEVLSSPTKAVKSFEGFNGLPAWAPDGKHLAYVSGRPSPNSARRRGALVIRDVEGGQERELFPQVRMLPVQYIRWSPDGRSILCGRSLQLVDVDTGTVTDLVENLDRRITDARWSQDGRAIFYMLRKGNACIMVYDLETGEAKELHRGEFSEEEDCCLAVSPDGRQLAFVASPKTLKVMPVTGGEPREILRLQDVNDHFVKALAWAVDGHQILYGTKNKNRPEVTLCRVSVDDGKPQILLEMKGRMKDITAHPDGRRIAFTVAGSNEEGTWVMENFLPDFETGE